MPLKPDACITDIIETLGNAEDYVRGIVGSFIENSFDKERSTVRIGISGSGRAPNYSIEEPCELEPLKYEGEVIATANRRKMAFNGRSHKEILEESFEGESWSSAAMTFAEVLAVLGDLRRFKKTR